MKASDNEFPSVLVVEQASTPTTPATGNSRLFVRDSDHVLCSVDDAGGVQVYGGSITDPTTTRGDIIVRDATTLIRLALGASGKVATSDGTDLGYAFPSGHQYDYVEFTGATTNITATTEATANTIVTANGVAFDGSTAVMIEFYAFAARPQATAAAILSYYLYDDTGGGAASIGRIGAHATPAASNNYIPTILRRKMTPTAATHTFSIRGATSSGTAVILAGAGGNAADMPGYIRITKV